MANKMIIDASHPEETRVVVLRGNRVEEFDFESASKRPLRGNIYLAKVTRVEPSLQAAFIDYGGNRHGFLAFSETHPDYYRIPVIDRHGVEAVPHAANGEAAESGEEPGVPLAAALPEPVRLPRATAGEATGDDASGADGPDSQPDGGDDRAMTPYAEAQAVAPRAWDAPPFGEAVITPPPDETRDVRERAIAAAWERGVGQPAIVDSAVIAAAPLVSGAAETTAAEIGAFAVSETEVTDDENDDEGR